MASMNRTPCPTWRPGSSGPVAEGAPHEPRNRRPHRPRRRRQRPPRPRNQAVITAAKVLADAYAGSGVTVNVVNPGVVVTGTPSPAVPPATPGESTPEQVAALVAFLCSAPAAAISGESVAVGHRVRGVQ